MGVGNTPNELTGSPFEGVAPTAGRGRARGPAGAALLVSVGTSCSGGSPSVLDPAGAQASRIDGLWWLMLWISAAVALAVFGLMVAAIVRRRRRGLEIDHAEPRWGDPFVVVAGVVLPVLILTGVFVASVRDLNAIQGGDPRLTVDVIGHVWWWEGRYPGGAVVANELHIPVGQTVAFRLTTADVIHSFWVPQLAQKLDMIPGRANTLLVRADEPGTYRGQCAEFCGLQHAHMALSVVAEPPAEFAAWLRRQAEPAATPEGRSAAGLQVFLGSSCAGCHTIRGTEAAGTLGPDLTHIASRETIAARTLTNTHENLRAWIADPQAFKPGAVMPPTELSSEELRSIVQYLEGLT
jgi:cytochrome c oxidase subunit II